MRERATPSSKQTYPEVPRLARVIRAIDRQGTLEVILLKEAGSRETEGSAFNAYMLTPFAGQTSARFRNANDDYNGTQKSYGMWFVPPDIDTIVLVIFVGGNTGRAYWIGCIPDADAQFMVPGIAATQFNSDGGTNSAGQNLRVPVAEVNKVVANKDNDGNKSYVAVNKPTHLFANTLKAQGLDLDDTRGITNSSSSREIPSRVFGISTPGPVDLTGDFPSGNIGPADKPTKVPGSRLGGTTFVMDDGSPYFTRKTKAKSGPPEYASVAGGETTGDPSIPHNELVRIRTRTGHQILLHNSEDLIYIANAAGTAWIELTSNGKIDIFAADSISVHTKTDINFYADRDINMEAGRNFNIKATGSTTGGRVHIESIGDTELVVGGNGAITSKGNLQVNTGKINSFTSGTSTNIKSSTNMNFNSGKDFNIKASAKIIQNAVGYYSIPGAGGTAAVSEVATTASKVNALSTFDNVYDDNGNKITSIMKRIPNVEPWAQHENLDPLFLTASATDRESSSIVKFTVDNNTNSLVPKYYKTYTTATDVFDFIPVQSDQGGQ
jgi:hypothetical protein